MDLKPPWQEAAGVCHDWGEAEKGDNGLMGSGGTVRIFFLNCGKIHMK